MGGAAIAVGGLIGSAIQASLAAREGERNRAFQLEMSNTAMQRRTVDLEAAGLNRMLAYTSGGATGTGAAQASFSASGLGIGTVVSALKAKQELKEIKARTKAENSKAELNLRASVVQRGLFDKLRAEEGLIKVHTALGKAELPGKEIEASLDRPGGVGETTRIINRIMNSALGTVRGAVTGKRIGR